jgi:hypothetical protein
MINQKSYNKESKDNNFRTNSIPRNINSSNYLSLNISIVNIHSFSLEYPIGRGGFGKVIIISKIL